MAKRIKFADLIPIYRGIKKEQGDCYRLEIANELIRDSLMLALDDSNCDESGITVRNGDYSSIKLGDVFILDISPPRVGLGILAKNFSDYLKAPGAKVKERKNFYLQDWQYHCPSDGDVPPVVNRYRQLLRFIQLLAGASHYLDESKEELVFYKDGRFFVPVHYDEEVIKKLNFQAFEDLERFVLDPYHKEHKLKMLGDNVGGMLESVLEPLRFGYLVENIPELYKRMQVSYALFVADHSYEKALSEVNAFKIEAVTKIHKALSDIQAQILGIPIATFIALSQLKVTGSLNAQFASNSIIFLGVIVFCALLVGFLVNQRGTLKVIETEISRQRTVFERKYADDEAIYKDSMNALSDRLFWQFAALYAIFVLAFLMLAVSFVYYIVHTRPIFNWLFT
jgi:hypothetical protein